MHTCIHTHTHQEKEYSVLITPSDIRFSYSRFCQDVQPTGSKAAYLADELPRDQTATSPLAVHDLEEWEYTILDEALLKLATFIRKRRCTFRRCDLVRVYICMCMCLEEREHTCLDEALLQVVTFIRKITMPIFEGKLGLNTNVLCRKNKNFNNIIYIYI